uniref:Uncharacterized protein n=1 Tax=Aegilops tauschii subsp. strangulata TaxID=200361 RepID=A0A453CNE4_AEGTS
FVRSAAATPRLLLQYPQPCRVVNQPTPTHRRSPAPASHTNMELRLRAPASPASASPRGTSVSPSPRPHPRLPSQPIQKRLSGSAVSVSRRGTAARSSPCSALMTASYKYGNLTRRSALLHFRFRLRQPLCPPAVTGRTR